jgi:hypothetical protein
MRIAGGLSGLALAVSAFACGSPPTDPAAGLPPEVRTFLRADESLIVRATSLVLEDRALGVTVFRVQHGEPHDCHSGCFYLTATGVRAGGRTGWVRGFGATPTAAVFPLAAEDSVRFTPRLLDELKVRDIYAFGDLAFALACAASTSVSVREKLLRENPTLPVPLYCPK